MMGHEEMAAQVREMLDNRGIAYENGEGGDNGEQVTIWSHNGFWIMYMAYTDENGVTRSRMSVSAGFTSDRRELDAEALARVIEALS